MKKKIHFVLLLILGGCTTYKPLPLDRHTSLAPSIEELARAVPLDAAKGLSLSDIAVLAVENNPDLKAQRLRMGVAGAELYAAKLFPDPQLSASFDHPTTQPGNINAFGLGLDYDIVSLITRGERVESGQQALAQTSLELLWQEWQVGQQARSLAVRWIGERDRLELLDNMQQLYAARYRRSTESMQRGDLTLETNGTDLTALLDSLSQISQLRQEHNATGHALHLLLGPAPEAPLPLAAGGFPESYSKEQVHAQLAELPNRRPDLLALQAGYRSQEAKVHAAILAQFPSVSIGITRARDTSNVYTSGLGVGLELPLFSGSRGAIAVERATREQLRAEYRTRIDQAAVAADELFELQNIVNGQKQQLEEYLPTLEHVVESAREAYQRGDMDALTFLNMESTWINKRLEQIDLSQLQWENRIALQTILALPAAAIDTPFDGETNHEK